MTLELAPRLEDIELLPLSDHEWRVSDNALTEREGFGLLGFVERTVEGYEVMRLGAPLERVTVPSMPAAIRFLCTAP